MSTKRVKLTFPEELITQPILFSVAKRFDVVPNIRRAKVSSTVGEIVLELSGEDENLDQAITEFENQGVVVEPISGDILGG
ncbi:MAG: ferredoxin [Candidatus Omnitrophica bacterium]|nr:ferredoxin [Candidatus Omnitrophota bacterium]MCA9426507.1 ferredoxin [Candidatus Omnitrophota bacterium]MCA9437281.1 ferredoxin [Candidatus Omnitrophota bacterium]MCA9445115.1 ferredoxin [Candidatus Omnitrophota bacterium]MCB9770374.1 ferredoxin [Candidatus Omnitrophota bacterium]